LYSHINLEINKFIKKSFKDNGFLLNCCKVNLTESKLRVFVSYVSSLHTLNILKNYPQLSQSTLFSKKKTKSNNKQKINLSTRIRSFLTNKISTSEKSYKKTFLDKKLKQKSKLNKKFNSILDCISKKHKYSKLEFFFREMVHIQTNNFFFVQFQKLKPVKIFLIYFHKITQEQNRLKTLVYQSLTNFGKITKILKKTNISKYYLKYVKSITKDEPSKNSKRITLSINNSLFSSKQVKRNFFQKIKFSKNQSFNFLERIIESLTVFTQRKCDIMLILHETKVNLHDMTVLEKNELNFTPYFLNKEYQFVFSKKNQVIKKIMSQLRQYKNAVFFEETIQLVFLLVYRLGNPKLFTKFIASQFKSKKNHYFFFRFIRKVLSLFFLNKLFKIKSMKMTIKGRINGSKRSKKRSILIGKQMPLMFLDSNIEYSKSTIYGPHGTFGVKI